MPACSVRAHTSPTTTTTLRQLRNLASTSRHRGDGCEPFSRPLAWTIDTRSVCCHFRATALLPLETQTRRHNMRELVYYTHRARCDCKI